MEFDACNMRGLNLSLYNHPDCDGDGHEIHLPAGECRTVNFNSRSLYLQTSCSEE